MRRLIVVFNARSSKSKLVTEEVLKPARNLAGFLVGKYEIEPTNFDDNVERLAKILNDEDLVVAAGGDATASIALNGCMNSGKRVVFAALSFGNFCDTARTLGKLDFSELIKRFLDGEMQEFFPLDVKIDEKHFRYAAGYLTVGMFAESTRVFEQKVVRKELKGGRAKCFSYFLLLKWYLKNRRKKFLPDMTDYVVMNGTSAGGIMRGKRWFLGKKFSCGMFDLAKLFEMVKFMVKAILKQVPGEEKNKDVLEFGEMTKVTVQVEGESKEVWCKKIGVEKNRSLRVIMRL